MSMSVDVYVHDLLTNEAQKRHLERDTVIRSSCGASIPAGSSAHRYFGWPPTLSTRNQRLGMVFPHVSGCRPRSQTLLIIQVANIA